MAEGSGTVVLRLTSKPGIKRDGTVFDGDNYTDAQWCRFQRNKPRKIGGFSNLTSMLSGVSRGMHIYNAGGLTYTYSGWSGGIDMLTLDRDGNASPVINRTPAAGFITSPNNLFQFATIYDAGNGKANVIAYGAPNLQFIDSDAAGAAYIGMLQVVV